VRLPAALVSELGAFEQMIAVGIDMPSEWTGCIFLIDPHVPRDRADALASAQRLARRLVPAIYNVYLLRRVRSRSVAEERARMARELHDTVVQSVLGVQVQLHALAVQASGVRRDLAEDLTRLGLTLREEVLRLRELMRHMKPIDPTPDQLMDAIAASVQRFETETGIRTRFITRADHVPLLPRDCLEVMRIVQEALVNVRRHSGARNVFVRFTVADEVCSLWIEDDGNGFPFVGRLSLSELDGQHQGPSVIKERVRRLGGQISVESAPGHGSRLEISFPVSMYALQ
jgi:two-component system nitrate/nitrite sensor histidine kinase NarX